MSLATSSEASEAVEASRRRGVEAEERPEALVQPEDRNLQRAGEDAEVEVETDVEVDVCGEPCILHERRRERRHLRQEGDVRHGAPGAEVFARDGATEQNVLAERDMDIGLGEKREGLHKIDDRPAGRLEQARQNLDAEKVHLGRHAGEASERLQVREHDVEIDDLFRAARRDSAVRQGGRLTHRREVDVRLEERRPGRDARRAENLSALHLDAEGLVPGGLLDVDLQSVAVLGRGTRRGIADQRLEKVEGDALVRQGQETGGEGHVEKVFLAAVGRSEDGDLRDHRRGDGESEIDEEVEVERAGAVAGGCDGLVRVDREALPRRDGEPVRKGRGRGAGDVGGELTAVRLVAEIEAESAAGHEVQDPAVGSERDLAERPEVDGGFGDAGPERRRLAPRRADQDRARISARASEDGLPAAFKVESRGVGGREHSSGLRVTTSRCHQLDPKALSCPCEFRFAAIFPPGSSRRCGTARAPHDTATAIASPERVACLRALW